MVRQGLTVVENALPNLAYIPRIKSAISDGQPHAPIMQNGQTLRAL